MKMHFAKSVLTLSGNLHPLSLSIIKHSSFPVTLLSALMQIALALLDPIRTSHITKFFQLCSIAYWDCLVLTSAGCFPSLQFSEQELTFANCAFNLARVRSKQVMHVGIVLWHPLQCSDSALKTVECILL